MNTFLSDTHPDAQAVQDALLRKMTTQEKVQLVSSMTQTVIHHAKRAIRRNDPLLTDREVELRFVQLHYGEKLAHNLSDWLDERDR